MALDQRALLELLAELKLQDANNRIRLATATLCQELTDVEAAAFLGAVPFERRSERVANYVYPQTPRGAHRVRPLGNPL